jgi:hypothetical protein
VLVLVLDKSGICYLHLRAWIVGCFLVQKSKTWWIELCGVSKRYVINKSNRMIMDGDRV